MRQKRRVNGRAFHVSRLVAPRADDALYFLRLFCRRPCGPRQDGADVLLLLCSGGVDQLADRLELLPLALGKVGSVHGGLLHGGVPFAGCAKPLQQTGEVFRGGILRLFQLFQRTEGTSFAGEILQQRVQLSGGPVAAS